MPGTKITCKFINTVTGAESTKVYHATGAIGKTTDAGKVIRKTFVGREDGETTDGAMVLELTGPGWAERSQKEEAE